MNWTKKTMFGAVCMIVCVWIMGISSLSAKPKVAAIYTLPVEQQWISRIHKALNASKARGDIEYVFSESVKNTDYERVMREYADKGMDLVVGEVFGVERGARKVAKDYPGTAFLMGSSFGPSGKNFSVFERYACICNINFFNLSI